jgi:hypothetical protein
MSFVHFLVPVVFSLLGIFFVFVPVGVMVFVLIGIVVRVKIVFAHEFGGLEVVVVPLVAVAAVGHLERVLPAILVFYFFIVVLCLGRARKGW